MSQAKVDEWLHSDRGSPWKHADGGKVSRERAGEILSRGRIHSPETDLNLTPLPPYGAPGGPIDTQEDPGWIPQFMGPDTTQIKPPPLRGSNKAAKGGGIVARRDDGGATPIGGPAPSVQTANPMEQGMIQRYSSMSDEKLAEMAAMMGASPQGQMIQKLLMQRRTMPQQTQPTAPAPQAQRRGGATLKRDAGGVMSGSEASPWWTRAEARGADSGFLHGSTPGRADQIQTTAPGGAYVIPADVISGLGEGNSLAGARVMQAILESGPHGTPMPRSSGRSTAPHPPPAYHDTSSFKAGGALPIFPAEKRRAGGVSTGKTAVDLSDGEFVVAPHHVDRIGGGNRKRGHRILDKWVLAQRAKHIAKLTKLPGPVKT